MPGIAEVLAVVDDTLLSGPPTPFMAMHAAVALCAAEDADGLATLARCCAARDDRVHVEVAAPLAQALRRLVLGESSAAADAIAAVEPQVWRVGGSDAQREVVEETRICALVRAGRHAEALEVIDRRLDRRHCRRDDVVPGAGSADGDLVTVQRDGPSRPRRRSRTGLPRAVLDRELAAVARAQDQPVLHLGHGAALVGADRGERLEVALVGWVTTIFSSFRIVPPPTGTSATRHVGRAAGAAGCRIAPRTGRVLGSAELAALSRPAAEPRATPTRRLLRRGSSVAAAGRRSAGPAARDSADGQSRRSPSTETVFEASAF